MLTMCEYTKFGYCAHKDFLANPIPMQCTVIYFEVNLSTDHFFGWPTATMALGKDHFLHLCIRLSFKGGKNPSCCLKKKEEKKGRKNNFFQGNLVGGQSYVRDGGKCSTRKVFDWETVRQFRVSLGWVLSNNFRVGQLPCRTWSSLLLMRSVHLTTKQMFSSCVFCSKSTSIITKALKPQFTRIL